ncbi:hypothetical protein Tco_0919349, partial [Tanacetum coccineum]
MGDEHLSTIPEKESDELIKSSVENLVLILRESEVTSDNKSECDVPVDDESSLTFMTFSNPLFDSNDDFTSSVTPPFLHIAAEANLREITVVILVRDRCPRGK